mmetsp:Transcript_29855/g.45695  ORF Transcript_29855/g.45695 Transcript_29855/m.45695 type:complete len:93 (-) Transcript_29855:121-399(-)
MGNMSAAMQNTHPRMAIRPTSLYCFNPNALGCSVSLADSVPIMMDVQVRFPANDPRLKAPKYSDGKCRPMMEAVWGYMKKLQNCVATVGRAM